MRDSFLLLYILQTWIKRALEYLNNALTNRLCPNNLKQSQSKKNDAIIFPRLSELVDCYMDVFLQYLVFMLEYFGDTFQKVSWIIYIIIVISILSSSLLLIFTFFVILYSFQSISLFLTCTFVYKYYIHCKQPIWMDCYNGSRRQNALFG